jgi:hypothetical protein
MYTVYTYKCMVLANPTNTQAKEPYLQSVAYVQLPDVLAHFASGVHLCVRMCVCVCVRELQGVRKNFDLP